jgi:hypothetical protein
MNCHGLYELPRALARGEDLTDPGFSPKNSAKAGFY